MIQNKFGELIFSETDVCELIFQGRKLDDFSGIIIDDSVNLKLWPDTLTSMPKFLPEQMHDCTVEEFHTRQQNNWHMPDDYKNLDIAEYVLNLCQTQDELQRCGQELLMFQERNLFNLLRYLKYLVDIMSENQVIWGVGRGSSVASYVLYKLRVHRIDSMYYNLDIAEFLR